MYLSDSLHLVLLGLELKFCIKIFKPNANAMSNAFDRLKRDVRINDLFADEYKREYNSRLYIKSKWDPPQASANIENRIKIFQYFLTSTQSNILQLNSSSSNLSCVQNHLLNQLLNYPKFIILDSDKNLGLTIIKYEMYTGLLSTCTHLNNS